MKERDGLVPYSPTPDWLHSVADIPRKVVAGLAARRGLASWLDRDELAGAAILDLVEHASEFNGGCPLEAWARRRALFAVLHAIRDARARYIRQVDLRSDVRTPDAPPERAAFDLQGAITALPEKQRIVILLAFWYDLTQREISEALDISQSAVSDHLRRAKKSILLSIKQNHGDVPTERHAKRHVRRRP